ncbi:hypothetical protein [Streptomyces lasiicapitis]|uniref:Membrane protein YndG n=1 Tax=Streptomyces lasiicapitis TaxID=1923961 RepID=A0ABQ2LGZ3_9ACTN|nr:hypothetical protein [Streptomyces lasiicapitis]GGO33311.1 hypothetical protein GCM10012286_00700 [Streptomyces lasiicapitis]
MKRHGSPPGLYVEALIRADLDELWEHTQEPALHQRWDLRFTEIDYLPAVPGEPQGFRYATRVLPFLAVAGTGVSAGERRRPDGTRTSALRFASSHPLSLLAEGSGYWRYVPTGDGVRFLTGYDYRPRWGRFGVLADRAVMRPLMGWATAWSFDRLRLWLERGITPERGLAHGVGEVVGRALCVAAAWGLGGPVAALAVAVLALVVPPLPGTPAARRCLRTPSGRVRAPRLLDTLTAPEGGTARRTATAKEQHA